MQVRPVEIVIIALLAIVLLCLAFLFYNQTLLREEIKTNHEAVEKIQGPGPIVAQRSEAQAPIKPQSPPNHATAQPTPVPPVQHAKQNPQTNPPKPTPPDSTQANANPPKPNGPITPAPYLTPKPTPANPPKNAQPNRGTQERNEQTALADFGPTVEQIIKELYQGKYPDVLNKCTPEYADLVGDNIGKHMDKIRNQHGMLKTVMGRRLHDVDTLENQKIFKYTVDTDKGQIVLFTITLQVDNKKIAGLFFKQVPLGG